MTNHHPTRTPMKSPATALILAVLAIASLALAPAAGAAPKAPTAIAVAAPSPGVTASVTVDCNDFEDPIRVHLTNTSASDKLVSVNDGGPGWTTTLAPGETQQGPVWFNSLEADSTTVHVAIKDNAPFFTETIEFDHSCFGPNPDYDIQLDCQTGDANVLFTNEAITPTWAVIVYEPQPPGEHHYITHISPALVPLEVEVGESVDAVFYGDGHAMFNGTIDFDCPSLAVEPPVVEPEPNPSWVRAIVQRLLSGLRLGMLLGFAR